MERVRGFDRGAHPWRVIFKSSTVTILVKSLMGQRFPLRMITVWHTEERMQGLISKSLCPYIMSEGGYVLYWFSSRDPERRTKGEQMYIQCVYPNGLLGLVVSGKRALSSVPGSGLVEICS